MELTQQTAIANEPAVVNPQPQRPFGLGLALLGGGVALGLMTLSVFLLFTTWRESSRGVGQNPAMQREHPLIPLPVSATEERERLKREFDTVHEQYSNLAAYRDWLEATVQRERQAPADAAALERLEGQLQRVRAECHQLQAARDRAYQAWQASLTQHAE
jgi:hypothetical protein